MRHELSVSFECQFVELPLFNMYLRSSELDVIASTTHEWAHIRQFLRLFAFFWVPVTLQHVLHEGFKTLLITATLEKHVYWYLYFKTTYGHKKI